jgi:hypothetical protein
MRSCGEPGGRDEACVSFAQLRSLDLAILIHKPQSAVRPELFSLSYTAIENSPKRLKNHTREPVQLTGGCLWL